MCIGQHSLCTMKTVVKTLRDARGAIRESLESETSVNNQINYEMILSNRSIMVADWAHTAFTELGELNLKRLNNLIARELRQRMNGETTLSVYRTVEMSEINFFMGVLWTFVKEGIYREDVDTKRAFILEDLKESTKKKVNVDEIGNCNYQQIMHSLKAFRTKYEKRGSNWMYHAIVRYGIELI